MTRSHAVPARPFFRHAALGVGLAALALLGGCSGDAKKKAGPCTRGELTGCGATCSESSACDPGLYCGGDKTCTAECVIGAAARDCGRGASCSPDGRCLEGGDAGQLGSSLDGASQENGGDGSVCGTVSVGTALDRPNVILIVDQSGSMTEKFGNTTRWDALKNALLANDGLIASLQDRVNFGLALYSSRNGGPTCPLVTEVKVAAQNLDAIRAVYEPAQPIDDTPTGAAIQKVLKDIVLNPDQPTETVFVLATDGEPDTCAVPDPQTQAGKDESLAAVKAAFDEGIKTYVIAVAENSDTGISDGHAQDLANTGAGMQGAPFYRVTDTSSLQAALQHIVGGVLSCTLELTGKVTLPMNAICSTAGVDVELNGRALGCQDADGWKLLDERHIEMQGKACDALKAGGAVLQASFPCGAVTPVL